MIKEAVKAASPEEAVELKKKGMVYMAGGTYLNWAESDVDAERVVLLEGALSSGISEDAGGVKIGALCTLTDIIDSSLVPEALRTAAGFIPSRNIRNAATIGGNIAANRTDSYVIPALLALNAEVQTLEEGKMSVYEYIKGGKSSLIMNVVIPSFEGKIAVDRSVRSSAAYPTVITAVSVSSGEWVVALGCIGDHVIRLEEFEREIASGKYKTEEELFKGVYDSIDPSGSIKESGTYRRYIASTLIARSVSMCMGEGN